MKKILLAFSLLVGSLFGQTLVDPALSTQNTFTNINTFVNPGVFTNTQMNEAVISQVNGCNPASEATGNPFAAGNFFVDAVDGCLHNSVTSAVFGVGVLGLATADNGLGGNGGWFMGHANGTDSVGIGIQAQAWDTTNGAFATIELVGGAFGVAATNAGAAYETLEGIDVTGIFTNQPPLTFSGAPLANAVHIQANAPKHWNRGLLIDDGATGNGIIIGAIAKTGTAASAGIFMNGINAGVDSSLSGLFTDSSGNLNLSVQSGSTTLVSGGEPSRLFSDLPTCAAATEGGLNVVTNSSTAVWGATVTGGGVNHILAYCDGTNWTVAAK